MYTLHYAYLFLLTISLSFCHTSFTMNESDCLSVTESKIFFREVIRIGIDQMSEKLSKERGRDFFHLPIEFKFYPQRETHDEVTLYILTTIAYKERNYGYLPNGKVDKITGDWLVQPTNILGNYTRYWRGRDENGPYIRCVAAFTQKKILEKALKDVKKTYYRSNL